MEDAGAHGLCLGGIGAGVVKTVPEKDMHPFPPVHAQDSRRQYHQPGRKPGRKEVGQVVKLCRRPAKIQVRFVFVPHHGIHGVHGFVDPSKDGAAQGQIKKRGDDPVRGIFRHSLHRSLCDACL